MDVGINMALRGAGGDYRQTGIGRYVTELASALHATAGPDDRLIELGTRLGPVGRRAATRIGWEQTALAVDLARRRLDVFHGPVNTLPVARRVPAVVTIHDLAFLRFPDTLTAGRRAWLIGAMRHSARTAERIIAISRQTASDLVAWLGIDAARVDVVPLAPASTIRRLEGAELRVFRLKYDLERPHILAVGTLEPRKNLPMLLRAFAAICNDVPHRLVLVGPEGWLTRDLHETARELELGDRLVMTGFADDAMLGGWYSAADLVAVPSKYEGFGLPVIEAMACGAPVLASRTAALPEVGGDAAIYVDPDDQQGWSEALLALLRDPDRRAAMRARGLARATGYSWQLTASSTWDTYRKAAR